MMISENFAGGELSPIVFYYDEIDGMEYLQPRLEERFRQTGHTRPIIFKEYDCYKELPGTDGDLYTYDAVVLTALVDKRFLRYGTSFYETFYSSRDILLQLLWEKAGWKPGQHKVTRLKHRKSS